MTTATLSSKQHYDRHVNEVSLLESSISVMLQIPHDYVHSTVFEVSHVESCNYLPELDAPDLDVLLRSPLTQLSEDDIELDYDVPLVRSASETTLLSDTGSVGSLSDSVECPIDYQVGSLQCSSPNRDLAGGTFEHLYTSLDLYSGIDAFAGLVCIEPTGSTPSLLNTEYQLGLGENLPTIDTGTNVYDAVHPLPTTLAPLANLPVGLVSLSGSTKNYRKFRKTSCDDVGKSASKPKAAVKKVPRYSLSAGSCGETKKVKSKRRPPMVKQYYFTQICNCLFEHLKPVSYKFICDYIYERLPAPPQGFSQISRESMESSVRKTVSMYTQHDSPTHKQVFAVVNQENGFVIMFHPEADYSPHYKAYLKKWDRG